MPRVRRLLAPLWARATWRGWTHLVLGGALLMPFYFLGLALAAWVSSAVSGGGPPGVWPFALFVLVLPAVAAVGFLVPAVRSLEAVAARDLLDAPIDDVSAAGSWAARWRTGLWFSLHLAVGGVLSALSLAVPPGALVLVTWPFIGRNGSASNLPLDVPTAWAPPAGVLLIVVLVYLVAGAGHGLARLAPGLLGPTPEDRVAELEHQAEALAERNRLARELHDSVGHALSIITVQAGAATRVQANDPAFVGNALRHIEEAARSALDDLDHVLGVLRADAEAVLRPQPTLGDLDRLVAATVAAGAEVSPSVTGPVAGVPPVVSREAYRIVQEGLSNALRHAGPVPVGLTLVVGADTLEIAVVNPMGRPAPGGRAGASPPFRDGDRSRTGGGRGLAGIRERVTVLRGLMSAGVVPVSSPGPSVPRPGPVGRSRPAEAWSDPGTGRFDPGTAPSGAAARSGGVSVGRSGQEAGSDLAEARSGPAEARSGPAEARLGPAEARSGPAEARLGPGTARSDLAVSASAGGSAAEASQVWRLRVSLPLRSPR